MGRRGDAKPKPTTERMIDTLGMSRLTTGEIAKLSGCEYIKTAAKLSSMYRLNILERDPDDYKPRRYWLPERDKDLARARAAAGIPREVQPFLGPGPRGGKAQKSRTSLPSPNPRKYVGAPGRSEEDRLALERREEIDKLLITRDAIDRRLKKLGHVDAAD